MRRRHHSTTSSKSPARVLGTRTLVLDNGAHTIKAGYADLNVPTDEDDDDDDAEAEACANAETGIAYGSTSNRQARLLSSIRSAPCTVIPNCLARTRQKTTHLGPRVTSIRDFGELQLTRPMENGMIVNWTLESAIWEESFFGRDAVVPCDPHETNLMLTESVSCPKALQTNCDQMVFEEFEFAGYWRTVPSRLNVYADNQELFAIGSDQEQKRQQQHKVATDDAFLFIDAGFSHTTVTPVLLGRPVLSAVRRLDIGGKHLTSFLREQLSIRNFSLMDETVLVNTIKEAACFTAPTQSEFSALMDKSWKGGGLDGGVVDGFDITQLGSGNMNDGADGDGNPPGIAISNSRFDRSTFVDVVLPDFDTRFGIQLRPHNLASSYRSRRLLATTAISATAATPTTPGTGLSSSSFSPSTVFPGSTSAPVSTGGPEFILPLGNERFRTPELLFSPADIGLEQAGLHQVVAESVAAVRTTARRLLAQQHQGDSQATAASLAALAPSEQLITASLLANIVLVGGSAKIPGLADRLRNELRSAAPQDCAVRVGVAEDPIVQTWRNGVTLANTHRDYLRTQLFVSRQEYMEHGSSWLHRKFAGLVD